MSEELNETRDFVKETNETRDWVIERENNCCSFCGKNIGKHYNIIRGRWLSCTECAFNKQVVDLCVFLKGEIPITKDIQNFIEQRIEKDFPDGITFKEFQVESYVSKIYPKEAI